MTGEELFGLFIADGTSVEDVAVASIVDLVGHISRTRQEKPDDIGLSDTGIAVRIRDYAQGQAGSDAGPRNRDKFWVQVWDDCWNWQDRQ